MNPMELARNATYNAAPVLKSLPTPVRIFAHGVLWIHVTWSGQRYLRARTDPQQFCTMLMAYFGDKIAGRLDVQTSIYWALVAERTLQAVEQAFNVVAAWNRLCAAFNETSDTHEFVCIKDSSSWVSPSTSVWLLSIKNRTIGKVKKIAYILILDVGRNILLFNMKIIDSALLLALDPKQSRPIQNLASDCINNGNFLLYNTLVKSKELIAPLLKQLNCPYTPEQLAKGIAPIKRTVEAIHGYGTQLITVAVSTFYNAFGKTSPVSQKEAPAQNDWSSQIATAMQGAEASGRN